MSGPSEASGSTSTPIASRASRPARVYSDAAVATRSTGDLLNPRVEIRRKRSDGHNTGFASGNNHRVADGDQQSLSSQTTRDPSRRDASGNSVRSDSHDPLQVAYLNRRQRGTGDAHQTLGTDSRRHRAATTSAYAAHGNPRDRVTVRPHAASHSVSNDEAMMAGALLRYRPRPNVDRPLPRTPSITPSIDSVQAPPSEYVVPRWQPDAEASQCPICKQAFGIFFRRHHCRKCGRVVCANCSPHRITIPRQYIVRSPEEVEMGITNDAQELLGTPRGDDLHPALGGGQEVRLCNPCVPDPNPLPPPLYPSSTEHHFTTFPTPDNSLGGSSRRPHSYHLSPSSNYGQANIIPYANARSDSLRSPVETNARNARQNTYRFSDVPANWHQAAIPGDSSRVTPGGYLGQFASGSAPSSSIQGGWPLFGSPSRHSWHRSHASTSQAFLSNPFHNPQHSSVDVSGPLPPSPPAPEPPIREEDECPICHYELPPKGLDGSETAREAHVASCVESRFSSSAPRDAGPPPETVIAAAVATSDATPSQVAGTPAVAGSPSSGILLPGGQYSPATATSLPQRGPSHRRRTAGMVAYLASEKDCIGEDGTPQECVICFEEFAVDDLMGRLECLCKFHRHCIRQWWDTKGAGSCPVHQDGI